MMTQSRKKAGSSLKVVLRRPKNKNLAKSDGSNTLESTACSLQESNVTRKKGYDGKKNCATDESQLKGNMNNFPAGKKQAGGSFRKARLRKKNKKGSNRWENQLLAPTSPCTSESTCDDRYSMGSAAEETPDVEMQQLENNRVDIIPGLKPKHITFDKASADIFLLSTDGGSVPAVQALLVAMSSKFSSMMPCKEDGELPPNISLGYDTFTIRAIVNFCHSGIVDMAIYSNKETAARALVWLVEASNFFKIDALEKEARSRIHELLSEWRPLACAVLDEAITTQVLSTRDLASIAMWIIRANPRAVLLGPTDTNRTLEGGGVLALDITSLHTVLNDTKLRDEAILMFRCLKLWAGTNSKTFAGHGRAHDVEVDRMVTAKKMVKKIQLSHIPPTELEDEVRESGLVTSIQLTDAYRGWARAVLENEERWKSFCSLGSPHRRDKRGGIVIVSNAGVDEVNGLYIASSNRNQKLYSKVGIWEGNRVKFHLYRAKQNWHLGLPNHDTPVEFYCAPLRADSEHIPPKNDWGIQNVRNIHCGGIEPSPSCVWISESPNLDDC